MAQREPASTSWADETDDYEEPAPVTKTKENAWAKPNPWVGPPKANEAPLPGEYNNNFPAPKGVTDKEPKREERPPYDDGRAYGNSGRKDYPPRERNEYRDYQPRGERPEFQSRGERPDFQQRGERSEFQSRGDRSGDYAPKDNFRRDDRTSGWSRAGGERGPREDRGFGERSGREPSGFGRREDGEERSRYRTERPPRDPVPLPTEPPFTAFIGNLPFDVREEDLYEFFAQTQSKVVNVRFPMNKENKPKGFGYVEFEDLESLKNAVSRNGEFLLERPLRIDVAEAKPQESKRTFGFRDGPRDFRSPESPTSSFRSQESAPGERPKLELKPRSADAPKLDENVYGKSKFNPFGEAKPRDESLYLKKIEEERKKRVDTSPPPGLSVAAEEQPTQNRPENQEEPKQFKKEEKGFSKRPPRNDRPNDAKVSSGPEKPFVRGSKSPGFRKEENKGKPKREERREERREDRPARQLQQEVKSVVDVTNTNLFAALPEEEDI